ncbi:MAG: hypothetical protein IKE24_01635 [Clostridia bacterium]|nr:hypothetical protein [Clostridia bacterium]
MKRLIAVITVLALMLSIGISFGETEVTVKNYKELVKAVNDQKAARILISPKYKHGTKEVINLFVEDRNITIAAQNGESAVIDGRVDIRGEYKESTVTFENVSIDASKTSNIGLWIGYGPKVIIDSVHGGDSKTTQGAPGAVVYDAQLIIGSVTGGDSVNGIAGDGIMVYGKSIVEAGEVKGGNCTNGVGGAGVVTMGGAAVTVTKDAIGGDGAVNPGQATLIGSGCTVEVTGDQKDGEKLESKKAPDPEIINSYGMLVNALRNGKKEIRLDRSFKSGALIDCVDIPFYVEGDGKVTILGAYDDKLQKVDSGFSIHGGEWDISGLDIQTKMIGLTVNADAHVTFTGNLSNTTANPVVYLMSGEISVKGNVTGSGNHIVIYMDSGKMTVEGTVTQKNNQQYSIYVLGGELEVIGKIKARFPYLTEGDGKVTVREQ